MALADAPNCTDFAWSPKRERAVALVAEDAVNDETIAAEVGISKRTLEYWKQHPVFQAKVTEYAHRLEAETLRFAIAKRRKRVAALQNRWERMQRVIEARAEDMADEVAGGETGLLVRTEKQIGAGEKALHVVEFAVDTGLLRELRAHEEQAAKELGQWDADAPTSVVVKAYIAVDVDRV